MSEIQANGLSHNGRIYCVSVRGFICDKPARSFLKCVKGHSGTYGCDKCTQSGVYIAGRMTFPVTKAPLRTDVPDVAFGEMVDDAYHHERYPLCQLALSMVTAFPLDYMHLVCLGVMKLFAWWFKGPLECRIGHHVKTLISSNLLPYQPFVSKKFVRKPRDLAEVDRWKATEFRQFLLYLGPVTLTGLIDLAMYNNFMLFPVAMYIYIYTHTSQLFALPRKRRRHTKLPWTVCGPLFWLVWTNVYCLQCSCSCPFSARCEGLWLPW